MLFLLVATYFFAAPIQFQNKYEYCKSVNFEAKGDYCSTQKKLKEIGEKYDK